ncbi:Clathrin light chain [Seminavis robusta]|uniref:Clathrin light chain n=1 Tax=Seminavis robusta TaxID=568900 RepID=A0A9N8DBK1_9STRA|nr:Clathrin light chain [Seminavis robusta]|eukprot:Sro66_g037360.1 Clathrin light chain (248) ;mRNA; f:129681-130424
MDDDNNFFAVAPPADGAPEAGDAPIVLGEAPPPVDGGGDFFGAPPADEAPAPGSFIGDVNETDNAFAAAPVDDAFAAPPADDAFGGDAFGGGDAFAAPPTEDAPIILGGPPPETTGEPEEEAEPAEPTGPSPMQKWNDEWQETLKTRKDEETAKKAELLEAARLALENFQKEREIKREAKMSKNREDEQQKLEAIEADLENDNSWQRVCKMVELSHDSTEKAEDVKRMRDALIYLKNDTARAEVLGS